MAVEPSLRKAVPNRTVPLKEPSVPQTANRRGWVTALSCCGTLGSDERRVPVVKTAKDQVFHRRRQGRTRTER